MNAKGIGINIDSPTIDGDLDLLSHIKHQTPVW